MHKPGRPGRPGESLYRQLMELSGLTLIRVLLELHDGTLENLGLANRPRREEPKLYRGT